MSIPTGGQPRITPGLVTEALAELPDRVRVGAYPIKLCVLDGRSRDRHVVWGLFCADEQAIYLNDEFPTLTHMASTLIHEVLHAIWFAQGLDDESDKEERIVTLMASGLTQVYRDNAWLAPWVERCFRFDRPVADVGLVTSVSLASAKKRTAAASPKKRKPYRPKK